MSEREKLALELYEQILALTNWNGPINEFHGKTANDKGGIFYGMTFMLPATLDMSVAFYSKSYIRVDYKGKYGEGMERFMRSDDCVTWIKDKFSL